MEDANRLIALAYERNDLIRGDDGFLVYWPDRPVGSLDACDLRLLADEIDRVNAPWEAEIERALAK